MYPDPAPKRYIARKRLRVGDGFIDHGEEFPAAEVTHSLLSLGWVVEDVHGELAPPAPVPQTVPVKGRKTAKQTVPVKGPAR